MNTIRSIEQRDVERVSVALARAFHHDPMMTHIVPNALTRARVLPWFLGKVVSYCMRFGEAYMSNDGMAAACWIPPRGGAKSWFERAVAAGGLVMPFVMGFRAMKSDIFQDPVAISLFGSVCVMVVPEDLVDLIHQPEAGIGSEFLFRFHAIEWECNRWKIIAMILQVWPLI